MVTSPAKTRWRPMVVAALLGLFTTIAVAFGIAALTDQWTIFGASKELTPEDQPAPNYLRPAWTRCVAAHRTPINAGADSTTLTLIRASDHDAHTTDESAWNEGVARLQFERQGYGWPIRSMYLDVFGIQGELSREEIRQHLDEAYDQAGIRTGVVLWEGPRNGTPDKRFPAAALPLGLLLDTAIFGLAWWLLLFGPTTLKRRRRLARGLCARCGYQVESADRCPECGTPNPRATT